MAEQNSNGSPRFTAPEAKVLIVDDVPTNVRVVKEVMSPCGVKVYVSLSGAKAVEMVQKGRYDLVFMDQMMPEMDGMEAVRRIRALGGGDDYFSKLPIVLLTANEATETEETLDRQGINGWITKPVNPVEIFGLLEKLLPAEKIIRP